MWGSWHRVSWLGLFCLWVIGSGCSQVGYVTHLGVGQAQTLLAREKLTPERIARLSAQEKQGLLTLQAARRYAETLGLGKSTSYRHLIERAIERTGGNKTQAAELLELSPRALRYKIRDYGIE